jgi:hypothetical protein
MNVFDMLYQDGLKTLEKPEWEITSIWDDTNGISWNLGSNGVKKITIDMVNGEMAGLARFQLEMEDGSFISLETRGKDFRYRKIDENKRGT